MTLKTNRTGWLVSAVLLLAGLVLGRELWRAATPAPAVLLEMSSTAYSTAQVYYDIGHGFVEPDSVTAAVSAGPGFQELRFPLKREPLRKLRFDPIMCAGTVEIRHMRLVDGAGRTLAEFRPAQILNFFDIASRSEHAGVLRLETNANAKDPGVYLPFEKSISWPVPAPGGNGLLLIALAEAPLLMLAFFVLSERFRTAIASPAIALDRVFARIAERLASDEFIRFDRWAIWFYAGCAATFLLTVSLDLNGSSMAFNTKEYHQYGPQTILAGTAKGIRSDEWNYVSPDIFYQAFRVDRFNAENTPLGKSYASLLGNLPVRHVTTIFRPQFWGFFALPVDYGFSFYWQMKSLIMISGVFTLLMALTGSSLASASGSLWLFFSEFTQWTFSWPSGLPEMCGSFCFVLVLAMYVTVGSRRWALAASSVSLAAFLVNFAMFAYVPHLAPYCVAGAFLFGGWVYAERGRIFAGDGRKARFIAIAGAIALTAVMLGCFYRDAAPAIEGIAATEYPGHRVMNGGQLTPAQFASHYFAPFEDESRFPRALGNICEAAGFEWLAPITLLAWGAMRALSRERRILLICLWIPALLLFAWDVLPIPASLGRVLLLDRVMGQRTMPALGLLNTAIVMTALSAPTWRRKLSFDLKLLLAALIAFLTLAIADSALGRYFSAREIVLAGAWLTVLLAFAWDGRGTAFAAAAVIPGIFCFGLVNPIARGTSAITSSQMFQFVERQPELRKGRWLVYAPDSWYGVFAACGLESYNDYHSLPVVQDFPLFRSRGLDVRALNSAGFFTARPAEEGRSEITSPEQGREIWSVNPHDPILKELRIRYIAFDHAQPPAMVKGLKPLAEGPVSGFWLYAVP